MQTAILHVYPTNDSIEHETDGAPCICCPRVEEGLDYRIVVHDRVGDADVLE